MVSRLSPLTISNSPSLLPVSRYSTSYIRGRGAIISMATESQITTSAELSDVRWTFSPLTTSVMAVCVCVCRGGGGVPLRSHEKYITVYLNIVSVLSQPILYTSDKHTPKLMINQNIEISIFVSNKYPLTWPM